MPPAFAPDRLPPQTVAGLIQALPADAVFADVGCFGWLHASTCQTQRVSYVGLDHSEPLGRPQAASFAFMADDRLDLADDSVDLAVASHVIEHLSTPVDFAA